MNKENFEKKSNKTEQTIKLVDSKTGKEIYRTLVIEDGAPIAIYSRDFKGDIIEYKNLKVLNFIKEEAVDNLTGRKISIEKEFIIDDIKPINIEQKRDKFSEDIEYEPIVYVWTRIYDIETQKLLKEDCAIEDSGKIQNFIDNRFGEDKTKFKEGDIWGRA